jgi:hypothetical protein
MRFLDLVIEEDLLDEPNLSIKKIQETLNRIDYLFFKGKFIETKNEWAKLAGVAINDNIIISEMLFYKIRENLQLKNAQPSEQTNNYWEESLITTVNTSFPTSVLEKLFGPEMDYQNGFIERAIARFLENASIIPYQDNYPITAKIHFLQTGASIILGSGGNPYQALQYAQIATTFAQQIIDSKPYYYAWTLAVQAHALFKIGDLATSEAKAYEAWQIFRYQQTGEFLGEILALQVLSFNAEVRGDFESAISFALKGTMNSFSDNKLNAYLLLIDLFLEQGDLNNAHKWLEQTRFDFITIYKSRDFRIKLREIRLIMEEGARSIAAQQMQVLITNIMHDPYKKIQSLKLLADNLAALLEFDQAFETGKKALEAARGANDPEEILKCLILLIDIDLQRYLEMEGSQEGYSLLELEEWLRQAYKLANKRKARLVLIQLDMYALLKKILLDQACPDIKRHAQDILEKCTELSWFRGKKYAEKILLLVDSVWLAVNVEQETLQPINEELTLTMNEMQTYLKELKQISKLH